MARQYAKLRSIADLTPRDECKHSVKSHRLLAHSPTKEVWLCDECGGHFIVKEHGHITDKRVLGWS